MTTPAKLSGATTTLTIDGYDMHSYGLLVHHVSNPPPPPKAVIMDLPLRDGAFDFSRRVGVRSMVISGQIIGDTHAQLMTNIDSVQSILRMRHDGQSFQVIFGDQTDRYWTCRYEGGLQIRHNALPYSSKTASFTLQLACVKPYAESTSYTSEKVFLHVLQNKEISYTGSAPTPLTVELFQRDYCNILEKVGGNANENSACWLGANATLSDDADGLYGDISILATKVSDSYGPFIRVTSQVSTSKYYVFGAWVKGATANKTTLKCDLTDYPVSIVIPGVSATTWGFAFVKVGPSELAGTEHVTFIVYNDGTDPSFKLDGTFVYEIAASEYSDPSYFPPPYMSDPSGDDKIPPTDPELLLHASRNLFRWKNGDVTDWGGWGGVEPVQVPDPFNPGGSCLFFATAADLDGAMSGMCYLSGGCVYQFTFDHFIEEYSGSVYIGFYTYTETGTSKEEMLSYVAAPVADSAWVHNYTAETYKVTVPINGCFVRFIVQAWGTSKARIYIKNISIVKVNSEADERVPYQVPDMKSLAHTGALEIDDSLHLDSDTLTGKFFDWSTKVEANAIATVRGSPLILQPGTNTLRLLDARNGSSTPEAASSGALWARLSYRARYL